MLSMQKQFVLSVQQRELLIGSLLFTELSVNKLELSGSAALSLKKVKHFSMPSSIPGLPVSITYFLKIIH